MRRGPRHNCTQRWQLAVLLLLPSLALAFTEPRDKAALLAFKSGLTDNGGILGDWDESTDPCVDQWTGVLCTCMKNVLDDANANFPVCQPVSPAFIRNNASRVLQLNLGDNRITDWNRLAGRLPAELGQLTALRILNLQNHNFTGSIPEEWISLVNIEHMLLSNNQLNGTLPDYIYNFSRLKYLYLENNQLSGPLPSAWCEGAWWMFDVRNNPGLCDEVPECLYDRFPTFDGTSLIDRLGDKDGGDASGSGGYCGVAPPTCRREEDACWIRIPEPPYWTTPTRVTFSFPSFPSSEGGEATEYTWRIGTAAGEGDVVDWTPFEGRTVTQTAEIKQPGEKESQVVTQVVYLMDEELVGGKALKQGTQYYVSVRGANAAGTLKALVVVSEPVTVDASPPVLPPGSAVYSSQYYSNSLAQTDTSGIGVSWDPWEDGETSVKQYSYQVFTFVQRSDAGEDTRPDYVGEQKTAKIKIKDPNTRSAYATKLSLEAGKSYFVRVYARNGAGLEDYHDSPPVAVVLPGDGLVVTTNVNGVAVSKVVIMVAALVGATSAAVAVVTVYFVRERYRRRQQESRKYRGQMRNLRHLLNSLNDRVGGPNKEASEALDELRKLKNVAFVITDLEGSTKIASAAPRAYDWVQDAHDALMRDLIASHGGYEINTEGDAFHVAFKDVATAVHFCMEAQYQMMEVEWPKEVLKLSECKEVRTADGGWAYRGPRVRMGIHWADEGSVVQHIHALTKHRVFTGPAFQVTRELCESARGGQVLLSHAGWDRLRGHMSAASFPAVEQLGCFKFASYQEPLWVYQVTRLLGRPLHRPHNGELPLTGAPQRLEPGAGLGIIGAPVPRGKGELVFVSCRLALEDCPAGSSTSPGTVPAAVHSRLYEVLATAAMQYAGFIFRMSESQGCYLVAFSSPVDAIRFCHTAQVLLMYAFWPPECSEWCGKSSIAPDGKALFKGPRLAMAVHESNDYSTRPVPRPRASPDGADTLTDYLGPAEEVVRVLSEVAHGGQVVLSEPAWKSVQDQLPGQPQVISLGAHALEDPAFPGPAMLMEVMPQVLAKRSFPPPQKARMVEPGFRDAPSAAIDVSIAHMRVVKPAAVEAAEAAGASLSDEAILRIITAYNVALARAVRAARSLLRVHGGYECKEPEPGKLTLAFSSLDSAVRWSAALQRALLEVHWPREVLSWDECREGREGEEEDEEELAESVGYADSGPAGSAHDINASAFAVPGGAVLWRGLRVRVGIACGIPTSKAPLNTGRADYFGTIPNLAARLMSLAEPGQVLLDGAKLSSLRSLNWSQDVGMLPGNDAFPEGLEIASLGQFSVKGLDELRTVYAVQPVGLSGRCFNDSPALVRPTSTSITRRMHSLRRGGDPSANPASTESPPAAAKRPFVFSSISRSGSVTGNGLGPRGNATSHPLLRSTSIFSDVSDGQQGVQPSYHSGRSGAFSSATSAGGSAGAPWVFRGLSNLVRKQHHPHSLPSPTSGSPRSAGESGGFVAVPILSSFGVRSDADSAMNTRPHNLPPASMQASSFHSDGTFMTAASADARSTTTSAVPIAGTVRPPTASAGVSLRDVSDWSCPGSLFETPTANSAVDHWDAGIAMEAVLKVDGLDIPSRQETPFGSTLDELEHGRSINRRWSFDSGSTAREVVPPRSGLTINTDAVTPLASGRQSLDRTQPLNKEEGGGGGAALQFAQQLAQLFVDRRRQSTTAAKDKERGGTTSPMKTSWLVGKLRGGSKEATPSGSPTKLYNTKNKR